MSSVEREIAQYPHQILGAYISLLYAFSFSIQVEKLFVSYLLCNFYVWTPYNSYIGQTLYVIPGLWAQKKHHVRTGDGQLKKTVSAKKPSGPIKNRVRKKKADGLSKKPRTKKTTRAKKNLDGQKKTPHGRCDYESFNQLR